MEAVRKFEPEDLPGLYRSAVSPGSPFDLEARQRVGVDLYVLQLQFCGVYLCCSMLAGRNPVTGMALSWHTPFNGYEVGLYRRSDPMRLLIYPLEEAEVWKKREDGTMLLRGVQWDDAELQRWGQTWLCGRNPHAISNALGGMSAWLNREYAKVKRPPYANDRPR